MREYQRKQVKRREYKEMYSGAAKYYTDTSIPEGKLLLVTGDLIFDGHIPGEDLYYFQIRFKNIVKLESIFENGMQYLLVQTHEKMHKFAVQNADEWINRINSAIENE